MKTKNQEIRYASHYIDKQDASLVSKTLRSGYLTQGPFK